MSQETRQPGGVPSPQQTLQAALEYLKRGWRSVVIPLRQKRPRSKRWQDLRLDEGGLIAAFGQEPSNIGLLLGEPSGGLVDIDLDCPEAVVLAPEFLPPTGRKSGRQGKPYSHYLYCCPGARSKRFQSPEGMLVELRSTGGQTVMPPSIHPTGEAYVWHEEGEAAPVDFESLQLAAAKLAATALLARSWPGPGSRQDAALAVAGLLLRGGMTPEGAGQIIGAAARTAGDDEADKRVAAVNDTAQRLKADKTATGGPKAEELIGAEVVKKLRQWLRLQASPQSGGRAGPPQSAQLIQLVEGVDLFHSPARVSYATVEVKGHWETWPIRGRDFKHYLGREFHERCGKAPTSQAIQDALNILEGKALYDGCEEMIYTRVGQNEEGIYLDLANEHWETVKIDKAGWSICQQGPVKFRRPRGMLALPTPEPGGSLDALSQFLNVRDERDRVLIFSWLLGALQGTGPYPLLAVHGEQGSAKSTLARILRELIDPNKVSLRAQPREERDLFIAANNSLLLCLDNMSRIPGWLSDALCRLSTGGGHATRELYTDDEETLFDAQRPCIINGIEDLATRPDLLDRTIVVIPPRIPPEKRRSQKALMADFYNARPLILGSLLSAVSAALARLPSIQPPPLPRMADFALWAMAGEEAMGFKPGTFIDAYTASRADANTLAIEASPFAQAITELMDRKPHWQGTATALLQTLKADGHDEQSHRVGWPKNARAVSNALRRLAPTLLDSGIRVNFEKGDRNTRIIFIDRPNIIPPSTETQKL